MCKNVKIVKTLFLAHCVVIFDKFSTYTSLQFLHINCASLNTSGVFLGWDSCKTVKRENSKKNNYLN